jgi:Flp pilus assembly protein TadG
MKHRRHRLGRAGNILIMVALTAVPLIGMVALAIDFGQTSLVKGKLDLAADEAALLATTAASNAWKAGDMNAVTEAIAAAQARFRAQTGSQSAFALGSVNVALTRVGGLFNATVNYAAQTPTTFARVLGINVLPISGQASASLSLNPFVDVQILMDVSSSMTLAATPEDITLMESLSATFKADPKEAVPDNASTHCSFACHWSATQKDYYQIATTHVPPVKLRITVLQTAVSSLINTLNGLDVESRFQLGLYTFGREFKTVYALSPDVANASAAVATILPGVNFCSGDSTCGDTYFSAAMSQLTAVDKLLPQTGNNVPQRFLFIVSDGVYDQYLSSRQIGAFSPAGCAVLKALGVSILVLYTPYTPIPSNSYYVQRVQPISGQIVPNLQACASSPSYYFVANDAADINTQLQNMLQLVVQTSSHLTN